MEKFEYTPKGVCAQKIIIDIEDNNIKNIRIVGGCPGNLLGISKLLQNRNIDEIIGDLEGIRCGLKSTSCPDQIAQALMEYKRKRSN